MTTTRDEKILHVKVSIQGETYEEDLNTQARIDPDLEGLNQALADHPGRFAWWSVLETLARAQVDDLESQMELLNAELFDEYQRRLTDPGGKGKPTLDTIKGHVVQDPRYQEVTKLLLNARTDLNYVSVGRWTMVHRKDSLLAIASNLRAEMDYDLSVHKKKMATLPVSPRLRDTALPLSGGHEDIPF